MNLAKWQIDALNFPYQDESLVEKLYIEYFAQSGKSRPRTYCVKWPVMSRRDEAFIEAYKNGKTLDEIGAEWGITRERVRQRLAKFGITREHGGQAIKSFLKADDRVAKEKEKIGRREQKHFERWGCSVEFVDSVSDLPRSDKRHPIQRFECQMKNAKHNRKIDWQLTFPQWWQVWQESGKWEQRGRGKGYGMARYFDAGPYSVDNVHIITGVENSTDMQANLKIKRRTQELRP